MHLMLRALLSAALILAAGGSFAQQPPAQSDPRAQQPAAQPIVPGAAQTPGDQKPAEQKAAPKPAPPKNANAPRNRTMQIDLPPLVPIAEIPRGKAVMVQGVVLSPQPTTFVLNDGNSSLVINLGSTWQALTQVKAGDRVRVIGQMDPYGASVFRAGSVMLENNRLIVVPTG